MRVIFTLEAVEQLDPLPDAVRRRVVKALRRLREWPAVSGVRALTGALAGQYRIRTGDYRAQFYLRRDEVIVVKVGHRDGFYDD